MWGRSAGRFTEPRELLRLRASRWRIVERLRPRPDGDCEEVELALERAKSWKLRRGERWSRLGLGDVVSVSGVIISCVCVSERMSLNSGVGVGAGASSASALVGLSRLWRILPSDGISSRWI